MPTFENNPPIFLKKYLCFYHFMVHKCSSIVRSDLNHAGTLVHHKMIETKVFLEEYWWIILKCWHILEGDIKERRNQKSGISNYMHNFEEIKIKAEKFAKKNYFNDWEHFQKSIKKTE